MSKKKKPARKVKGARAVKAEAFALRKKVGGWVEMDFDRCLTRNGVRWLRVKDGMGGNGSREDWVADLPLTVSVHDYQWKPPYFGFDRYRSMGHAMDAQLQRGIDRLEERAVELENKLAEVRSLSKRFVPLKPKRKASK